MLRLNLFGTNNILLGLKPCPAKHGQIYFGYNVEKQDPHSFQLELKIHAYN